MESGAAVECDSFEESTLDLAGAVLRLVPKLEAGGGMGSSSFAGATLRLAAAVLSVAL